MQLSVCLVAQWLGYAKCVTPVHPQVLFYFWEDPVIQSLYDKNKKQKARLVKQRKNQKNKSLQCEKTKWENIQWFISQYYIIFLLDCKKVQ